MEPGNQFFRNQVLDIEKNRFQEPILETGDVILGTDSSESDIPCQKSRNWFSKPFSRNQEPILRTGYSISRTSYYNFSTMRAKKIFYSFCISCHCHSYEETKGTGYPKGTRFFQNTAISISATVGGTNVVFVACIKS